jgi:hypothetical protein
MRSMNSKMYPDDVYRKQLSDTIADLEGFAREYQDVAEMVMSATSAYWKLSAAPHIAGACPFELLLRADQKFNAAIGDEVYEDKPIDQFAFFPMLARAIAAGNVERIEVLNALTGTLDAIETRVTLEDGWAWIGERRTGPRGARRTDSTQELRTRHFLPYRR